MERFRNDDRQAVRLFLQSGFVWSMCTDAYWLLLFVRVVADLDLPPSQLLLLGTAKEVSILVSEIPTGVVADVVSRKRSVWVAFVLCGVAMVLAGVAPGFGGMVVAQLLWGFGSTFRSGAETAWITDELAGDIGESSPSMAPDLAALFVRRAQWTLAGGLAGVVGAALIASVAELGVSLVTVGAVLTAWGMWLASSMPEQHFRPVPGRGRDRYFATVREARGVVRTAASLRWQMAAIVVAGCGSEAVDRLYVRRFFELGLPERISEVAAIGGLGIAESLLGISLAHAVRHRVGGAATAVLAASLLALTAVGVAAIGFASLIGVAAAGFVLQGGLRQATSTVHLVWTNTFAPSSSRATVHSFAGQAQSVGEISGGAIFGVTASAFSLPIAFGGSALLYGAAATFAVLGARRWLSQPFANERPTTTG